jgi:hypothetical protein
MPDDRQTIDLLWECVRCHLQFVWQGLPSECPKCSLRNGIPTQIIVGGHDVIYHEMRFYGEREGLLKYENRRGLSHIHLGDRCPHGYISALICPEC